MDNKKSYGEISDLNLKTIIALRRGIQYIDRKEIPLIREGGLTVSQFGVLEALYHKGDLRISEIIEKTLSTGGNMTVVIDNLEKEGLVSRYRGDNDRRVILVKITEKGRQLIEDIFPKHIENINDILSILSIDEKNSLIFLLKKLSKVIK